MGPLRFGHGVEKVLIPTTGDIHCDGIVMWGRFTDVPAVCSPNDGHSVSPRMQLLNKYPHVHPVAAVMWKYQNIPTVGSWNDDSQKRDDGQHL